MKVQVFVMRKKGVLHPESNAILNALKGLGFEGIQSLAAGKYIEFSIDEEDKAKAEAHLKKLAPDLLYSPNIEDIEFAFEKIPKRRSRRRTKTK